MFDRVTLSFLVVRKASIVFFCVSSNSVVPFNQIEEWTSCVSFFGVVSLIFGLLFQTILMKIVIKRLPDVFHSCSVIFYGAEVFNCVFREFDISGPV